MGESNKGIVRFNKEISGYTMSEYLDFDNKSRVSVSYN
jgi:hypothetical protein